MQINIKWTEDSSDCETCGGSWATGAEVYFDGNPAFTLTPMAHCYNGSSYEQSEVYVKILEALGHTVKEI
jgi:hypothetical protein